MIITKTPYRISFFGGGSDYPEWFVKNEGEVISTTINKFIYISCRYLPHFFRHKYRVVYSKIENVKNYNQIKHNAVKQILKYYNVNHGLEINYNKLTTKELKSICKEKNLTGFNNLKKTDLVELLNNSQIIKQEVVDEISSPSELNLDNVNTLEKNNENIETYNNEKEITLDVIET